MLADWEQRHPGRIDNVFRGLTDISPSQLADPALFDFAALGSPGGDAPSQADWLLGDGTMPD
jgi:tRNA 2-thiocytidine biosynthesis protein TtcA